MLVLMFVLFFLFLLIGVPVAVALAGSASIWVLLTGNVPDSLIIHRLVNGINSFPLLAVPFFILAGNLMNATGITFHIFAFARSLVGWMAGGLGHVNIGASVIFAGMSGAAVADAGGLGTIEIKAMRDAGYDPEFSVAVTAASSTIGPIIPPSLPLVIYGVLASVSVGQLFIAGLVPGLLMALALMVLVYWFARRRGYPRDLEFSLNRVGLTLIRSLLSLLTPLIIIGGIASGMFTPTEAAIAAAGYALLLGLLVYRTLTWKRLLKVTVETVETTSVVMFIVAGASLFAWVLTANRATEQFAGLILGHFENPIVILIVINLILLLVGFFMETIAALTILVPVLLPIAVEIGVDPVHFGVIVVLNLMIGLLTPPVGMVLYVLSRIAGVPFERCTVATLPFLVPLVAVLILVTFVPQLTLWLPGLLTR